MTATSMAAILEALAAGRIDAAEAARRIDALKVEESAAPSAESAKSAEHRPGGEPVDAEPWAAAPARPQHATFARERFDPPAPPQAAPEPPPTAPEPEEARRGNTHGGPP